MSLVDYASDDADTDEDEGTVPVPAPEVRVAFAGPSASGSVAMDTDSKEEVPQQSPVVAVQLPDVDSLLGPTDSSAGTTSSNPQRKREPAANGSSHQLPNRKVPRGNLRPSRTPPDTAGGLLVPPQLRGRSNVATEDLDKIFTHRTQRR